MCRRYALALILGLLVLTSVLLKEVSPSPSLLREPQPPGAELLERSSTIRGWFDHKPFDLEYGSEGQSGSRWKEDELSGSLLRQPLLIPPGAVLADKIEIAFDTPGSYLLIPLAIFELQGESGDLLHYCIRGETLNLRVGERE